jgi:hypothetical protein
MSALGGFLGGLGGSTIGASIVSLILETKKFDTGLVSARGRLTAATANMSSSAGKFSGLAGTAFVAAGAAAVAFGAISVKAALEAEEAQLKLANSIENSKTVTKSAIPAFNAQAEALRQLTGADDEAITGAQAFLVQMGLTEDQVKSLTPLIVDLSAKMGVDMTTAAKAVGKAVNGNIGSLARMGVVVDKTKASTDAYGATLDALGVAQGFAADQAKNQPWRLLLSDMEELAESLGKTLIPVLRVAVEELQAWADMIATVSGWVDKLTPSAEDNAQALRDLGEAYRDNKISAEDANVIISKFGTTMDMTAEEIVMARLAMEGWDGDTNKIRQAFFDFLPVLDGTKDKVNQTGRAIRHFRHMTDADIKKWVTDQAKSFADMSLTLSESRTDWRQTANQTVNAARRMARQAVEMKRDLDKLADLKAPTAFKEWLVEQGPGWISGYVDATRRGKDNIEGYWRQAANATKGQEGALKQITSKVIGLGAAVNQLPARKRMDIDVRLNVSSNVPIDSNTINDILSDGLVRGQTG